MSGGDILREVDEALRIEKATKFWEEHGKTLIVFVAALILGTAVQSGWNSYQRHQAEISTSKFLDALRDKEPLAALEKLNNEGTGSGSALAGLSAASFALDKQDWKNAIGYYEQVAKNKSSPKAYKDLAAVEIAALKLDHDEKATEADLLKYLTPVIADKDSAWVTRALFISAIVKANKGGNFKAAREDLQKLMADQNLPQGFLTHVKSLDDVYKIKGNQAK